ncbi:heptosyltransferase [candidate division MSBL1 archaeon SCGC-AAA382M17]|uniref:Heptosyltransferase n=1 Tax=candidate division MSBL1 archaeon SCGC-AAA382M17 TaxID=1698284 RepID=A0ABR5TK20_9EURY|nr:heptosyltransferase [candidate division MSBL1 archaeon SCGC-AAA382M17]
MKQFLIIQTAFIGDVILATPLIEKLSQYYPHAKIDFILRDGNQDLLGNNPHLNQVYILDKNSRKYFHVLQMIGKLRGTHYDYLINLQRFFTTGVISLFARSRHKAGFDKNPLSFAYDYKVHHEIGDGRHEIARNMELIAPIADSVFVKPRLYPSGEDYKKVRQYQEKKYLNIAPASVWYTKQFPKEKWIALLGKLNEQYDIHLIGGPEDYELCEQIIRESGRKRVYNLSGKLNFLETAALMEGARMNYVNDSAPLHIASAMNAPATAVFCSTIPEFGFYPVSDQSRIVETDIDLNCRPCGLHGLRACPEGHFKCAKTIDINKLLI